MIRTTKTYLRHIIEILILTLLFCSFFLDPPALAEQASLNNPKEKSVSINFNNVDIRIFIKFISNLTEKNFIIDRRVKGNITIISPKRISVDDAYKVFESVLDIHGFATVPAGQITKIIPAPNAAYDNVNTMVAKKIESTRDRIVTRIIPLEYANVDYLKPLLQPLVPPKSIIQSYTDTNMLIITSTLSSINRLIKIINTIDIQSTGKKISVIPVIHADAHKLTQSLSNIFTAKGTKTPKDSATRNQNANFIADARTNSIIVLANKTETKRIEGLIKILDQKLPKGEEKIKVYYLEHASAENLVKVLNNIPDGYNGKQDEKTSQAPLLSKKVKISADQSTNSLIIVAEKEDYQVLEEVISKLDIPRAMVYIECLIMEVNVNRGLSIGTEWRASTGYNSDTGALFTGFGTTGDTGYDNLSNITSDGSLPSGFSIGMLGKSISIGGLTFPSIQAVIHAYRSDKDVHILATPQLLTTENDEATITVGKNVPFQTRSAAESGSSTYSSFEYKDVGITLKITPQISKGRLVRLNVFQELTKLDNANQTTPDRPTTLKRHIKTSIIVEDANTVVIGGLIDESLTANEKKVPCLGDLPILGYGFKSISTGEEKTNLYVFLTPKVVQNPLESKQLFKEKKLDIQRIKELKTKPIKPIIIEPS